MQLAALTLTASFVAAAAGQTVVQGPVMNPGNGCHYYVLEGGTWSQMQAKAEQLGGSLARVADAAENAWITANLSDSQYRKLFIGLNDAAAEGTLAWSDGGRSAYRNWGVGQPANNAPNDYVALFANDGGRWYLEPAAYVSWGVVKIEGGIRVPQEYPTIATGLAAAIRLDAPGVELAEGTFSVDAQVLEGSGDKSRLLRGAGAGRTVILQETNADMFTVYGSWAVEGCTVRRRFNRNLFNCDSSAGVVLRLVACDLDGAGFPDTLARTISRGELALEGCTVHDGGNAVGLGLDAERASMTNCVLQRIDRAVYGSAGALEVVNCTLSECGASGIPVFFAPTTWTRAWNTVVTRSRGPLCSGRASFDHCVIPEWGPGLDNIVSADAGLDGRLRPAAGSVCIDAGASRRYLGSALDAAGGVRLQGASIDVGAFEAAPAAACNPDFNQDGFVDFFDYADFVAAFEGGC